jgi:hypothetical protein
MGEPGNPNPDVDPGPEPDPDRPGWASPTPPPPVPPAPQPEPPASPPPASPPPVPPTPAAAPPPAPPAWGTPGAGWTPPPGATPPPATGGGWTPGPPPRKRRLTWLWILIPVLLVFAASTVVVIVFAVRLVLGPVQTTNDYYADLRDRDYPSAYDRLCSAVRSEISETRFEQIQRSDVATKGSIEDYDFSSSHIENDDATTTGTVRRAGQEYDARIELRKEDGDWRICAVRER